MHFKWAEPFDNGGSEIQEYEIEVTLVEDSSTASVAVINSAEYDFTLGVGLLSGKEYSIRLRALNFFTKFYSVDGPWSAQSTFFASDLPLPVPEITYVDESLTKTDVLLEWVLHTGDEEKGFSTIDPYYLLWMDNCQGGDFTNLLVNSTSTISHAISNIVPGSVCRFRMNVLNIIGYSATYSDVLSLLFAVEPEAPPAPEYVDRHGGDSTISLEPFISIKWEEPGDNGGSSILGYTVEASEDGGDWTMIYDGSADPLTRYFKF